MVNLSDERWTEATREHEMMMDKLRRRDAQELGQVMKLHMLNKRAALMKALEVETVEQ